MVLCNDFHSEIRHRGRRVLWELPTEGKHKSSAKLNFLCDFTDEEVYLN